MAQKKAAQNAGYDELRGDIDSGAVKRLYYFYGEEKYLLEHWLGRLRSAVLADGPEEFNYKRFGANVTPSELSDAVDALPVFAEKTMVEIHDCPLFKLAEDRRTEMVRVLSDLPDFTCVVFVFDTVEFAPDRRLKTTQELLKPGCAVEFAVQGQDRIVSWIRRHAVAAGKTISRENAEYLSFITGGLMTTLNNEIEKLCAFCEGGEITRSSIDSLVTPVLDAVAYKMSDAVAAGDFSAAMKILDELLRMREPAHKIIFYLSMTMRQLLAARVCTENLLTAADLVMMCSLRGDYQARNLMSSARKMTLGQCRESVLLCSDTAMKLNSSGGAPDELLIELIAKLAAVKKGAVRA